MAISFINSKLLGHSKKFFAVDLILLLICWLAPLLWTQDQFSLIYLLLPLSFQLIFLLVLGNYETTFNIRNYSLFHILITSFFVFIVTFFVFKFLSLFFFHIFYIRIRSYLLLVLPLQVVFFSTLKYFFVNSKQFIKPQSILVIGNDQHLASLKAWLKSNLITRFDFRVETLFNENELTLTKLKSKTVSKIEPHFKLYDELVLHDIVLYFPTTKLETRHARNCLRFAAEKSGLFDFPTFCGLIKQSYPVDYLTNDWYISNASNVWFRFSFYLRIRSLIDIVATTVLSILLFPIFIIVSLLVFFTSKGPIFYTQERIGRFGKKFNIIKFRTMIVDAEKDGPKLATENDNRITKIGRFLRKTRLDEIPQLINVLNGDMGLIGPRPEREFFEKEFKEKMPLLQLRNFIKPGITGLAQVSGRYANDLESYKTKLGYDLYYISNLNPILDLTILLKTIRTILFKPGY